MLIDWFTVGAQALNFLILVWLLKRFLYKPILDAIDAREKRIASALADADKKKAEAQHERDDFQKKNETFDHDRAELLAKATADADAARQQLLEAARHAADALAAKRQEALANESKALGQALRQRAQTEVFAIAARVLADLASVSLETSACKTFIVRLRALQGPAKESFGLALKAAAGDVVVRSAFELKSAQRRAINKAVDDVFGLQLDLRYETAPAIVGGIELAAHGEKFAWNIADYLAGLERGVNDLLKAPAKAPAATAVSAGATATRGGASSAPPAVAESEPAAAVPQ